MIKLYTTFFKIGLFSFGGGYAMIGLLNKELCNKNNYCSEEELLDYYAIGQVTPGIIAVNTATFIGYKQKGILGAIVATLGIISPSVIIITILANILAKYIDNPNFNYILNGIKLAIIVLMAEAIINLFKKAVTCWSQLLIYLLILVVVLLTSISSVWIVIGLLLMGVLSYRG